MYNANVLLVCALGVFHNRGVVHLLHVNQHLHAGHLKREQEVNTTYQNPIAVSKNNEPVVQIH